MFAELLRAPIADVVLHHGEETLRFNLKYFEKSKGATFGTLESEVMLEPFDEINRYWATQPEEKQRAVFEIYRRVREALNATYDAQTLSKQLNQCTIELMALHPLDSVDLFQRFTLNCPIPEDIGTEFDPMNTNVIGTRAMTYIREDYKQLLTLSLAIRPMGVFWGEYINSVEKEVSNDWKEINAYNLLRGSWVYTCPAMERLETYIQANVEAEIETQGSNILTPALIAGIGSDEYPKWILSLTIMKRVVFADITARGGRNNFIQSIYGYMQSKLKNATNSFKGRINDKDLDSSIEGEEGKLSIFESYKAKIEVVFGDIAAVEYLLDNPVVLARQLEPEIEANLVMEAVHGAQVLLGERISDAQVTLMQWIFSNVFPVRIVPHLEKTYVVQGLAIAAAVLWNRDFKSLAALMTATPIPVEDQFSLYMTDEAVRVPKHLTEKLEEFYPYARRPVARKAKKKPNPGSIALNNMLKMLTSSDWYVNLPENWLSQVKGLTDQRQYRTQSDLRLDLTNLIIDINERTKNELPATCYFTHGTGH